MTNVLFKYNCVQTNAHPLVVVVHNRELSLAGDNNLRQVGCDYTRTYLILTEDGEDVVDINGVTPDILMAAMQWVVVGDKNMIKDLL